MNLKILIRNVLHVLVALFAVGSLLGVPVSAFATKEFSAEDYSYNELMTGDDSEEFGWDGQVLSEATGVEGDAGDVETGGSELISTLNTVSFDFGVVVTCLFVVLTLARFAGRGVYELAFDRSKDITPPHFLMSSEERGSHGSRGRGGGRSGGGSGWFLSMCKETLVLGLIVVGVWVIIGIIIGVTYLFFDTAVANIQDDTDTHSFSFAGIDLDLG